MKYAIFTVSLPDWSPEEAVEALVQSGYDGIEWRVTDQQESTNGKPGFWSGNRCTWPLSSFVEDAPRISELTSRAGLDMPSVGTYVTCTDLEAVERAMRGVARLGARQLRVGVPKYDGTESYRELKDRSLGQYREVAQMARQHGLRALIEMHHNSLTPSASSAASFLQGFDPQDVGVIHDAGNMVYEGFENYRLGLEVLGPYLGHVHLKNARWRQVGNRPDGSAQWEAGWAAITAGSVDMAALFRALRAIGYDGWLSFEDFSSEQPLARRIRDNLAYVKQVEQRVAEE